MDKLIKAATDKNSTEFISMAKEMLDERVIVKKEEIISKIVEGFGVTAQTGEFDLMPHMTSLGYKVDKDFTVDKDKYTANNDEIAEKMEEYFNKKKVKFVREGCTFVKPETIKESMVFNGLEMGKDYFVAGNTIQAASLDYANKIEDQLKSKKVNYTKSGDKFVILS